MLALILARALAQEAMEAPAGVPLAVQTFPIPPGAPVQESVKPGADLGSVIRRLPAGSKLTLEPGIYAGPIVIDRPMHLAGLPGAEVVGPGRGSVVVITAPDVEFSGVKVRGGGHDPVSGDAGVIVAAHRFFLHDLEVEGVLVGVDLRDADDGVVERVSVQGPTEGPIGMRGDGIRLWESSGNVLRDNVVSHTRDVVVWYSNDNLLEGNTVREGRYGVHFMHSDSNVVRGNHFEGDVVGVFIMYSQGIELEDNLVVGANGAAGMGFGCKESSEITVRRNRVLGNTTGFFLDTCPHRIGAKAIYEDNLVAHNHVGVRFNGVKAGAELRHNHFHEDTLPVVVTGGGTAEDALFSENRWSDYTGYDLDGDGIGDIAYSPRRLSRGLAEKHPVAAFFDGTPAAVLLDFFGMAFPLWAPPPLLTDERPLMGAL